MTINLSGYILRVSILRASFFIHFVVELLPIVYTNYIMKSTALLHYEIKLENIQNVQNIAFLF